jgi:cytochrome c556
MLRTFSLLLLAGSLLTACGEPEDTRPGQPVKTRQAAFKDILRAYEPITKMVKDDNIDPEKFATLSATLMTKRDGPWSHFGPDTNYPPTKAKPEVWEKAAAFDEAKSEFMAATDAMHAAAQSGDKSQMVDAYGRVFQSCKSCHDSFRKP